MYLIELNAPSLTVMVMATIMMCAGILVFGYGVVRGGKEKKDKKGVLVTAGTVALALVLIVSGVAAVAYDGTKKPSPGSQMYMKYNYDLDEHQREVLDSLCADELSYAPEQCATVDDTFIYPVRLGSARYSGGGIDCDYQYENHLGEIVSINEAPVYDMYVSVQPVASMHVAYVELRVAADDGFLVKVRNDETPEKALAKYEKYKKEILESAGELSEAEYADAVSGIAIRPYGNNDNESGAREKVSGLAETYE